MIFILDNYDSFTYNLAQYIEMLGEKVVVKRNDEVTPEEVLNSGLRGLVLSPGPGRPEAAGIMPRLIPLIGDLPTLGVCLGHQAIGYCYGGEIVRAKRLMHGKLSPITHNGLDLFQGIPQQTKVVRYQSLVIKRETLPECLEITAESDDGEIMGIRHKTKPLFGIQYHPESILTTTGKRQLKNFLEITKKEK